MYLEPWQVFLGGCVIGTLISFIVLTAFLIKMIGQIGVKGIRISDSDLKSKYEDVEQDLVAKLCFILLAKGYLDEMDNDFMLDKVAFNSWKEHIEEQLAELEDEEKTYDRDQSQR